MINLFATIISDAYRTDEKHLIADALDDLCNPRDSYGWSSAGLYSFWDYTTREVLYIGLAVDLEERYRQHNSLLPIDPNSCKKEKIDSYFKSREKLGYSIFVQSLLSQPITSKNQGVWGDFSGEDFSVIDLRSSKDRDDLKTVEGILIESYRMKHGVFPPWNSVGGSVKGQRRATIGNYDIVQSFSKQSVLVSKSTIRELSEDPVLEGYENTLFTARFQMLYAGMTWGEALDFTRRHDSMGRIDEMIRNGYFNKELIL